jgi:nitrogen fixation protein NifU and related proteins
MTYSAVVYDHFFLPRNSHRMPDADAVGVAGTPGRGPFMLLFLKTQHERIVDASFQTYGCGPAIAAGSVLTEKLKGATRGEARSIDELAINEALGGLPSHKRHCSALAAEALAKALADWKGL